MLQLKHQFASREDLVYEALKEGVLNGQFKPNETVNQTEIAQQLGVSIIPVRAAISRLVAEGLLSQDPYHSPQVSALSKAELDEVLLICMHLELLATRESIPHIGSAEFISICAIFERMSAAVAGNQLIQYGTLNREFHMAIYQHCPYPRLRQMIRDLWQKADIHRYRSMFDLVPDMAQHSQNDHTRLVQFIETQQVDEAVKLMEAHKTYSRRCFLLAFASINPAV